MKINSGTKAVAYLLSVALISGTALARPANKMTDLVGARASTGEVEMDTRGFTHIASNTGQYNTKHSYWWNTKDKNCLHVETYDGRYTAITDAKASDCNQRASGGDAAVAVGAVAGVAVLAALLSHKKHNHDNNQHHPNQVDESQYERGYNDGLHNTSYHNYDRNDYYAQGYQAGVEQRRVNTSQHSGRGGYARSVRFDDIQGMSGGSGIDAIMSRGFRNVDSINSGNTVYGIYYNPTTRQCVQMTLADRIVYDIRDIQTHPKCR
jgi:hypothetical protein